VKKVNICECLYCEFHKDFLETVSLICISAQWVPGAVIPVQRPEREAAIYLHLVPRLRMRGGIPPLPQCVFMARYLLKHRDNFTFTFITSWRGTYFSTGTALPYL